MKPTLFVLLLIPLLFAGCATRYEMRLNNGSVITAKGKPQLDQKTNRFIYTDASGQQTSISALRVIEVAPASEHKSLFNSTPGR